MGNQNQYSLGNPNLGAGLYIYIQQHLNEDYWVYVKTKE